MGCAQFVRYSLFSFLLLCKNPTGKTGQRLLVGCSVVPNHNFDLLFLFHSADLKITCSHNTQGGTCKQKVVPALYCCTVTSKYINAR